MKKLHLAKKDKTFDEEDRKDMVDQFIINERMKVNPKLVQTMSKMEVLALKHKEEEGHKVRNALEAKRMEAEEKQKTMEMIQDIVLEVGDEIVKTAMTGTILFAVRFEN